MTYPRRRVVSIDHILSKAYWTWRGSPALSVPTMFSNSLTALAQSILGVAVVGLIVALEKTVWLLKMAQAIDAGDITTAAKLLTDPAFFATAASFLVPAVVGTILVTVLASGFVNSSEFGSYLVAIQGSRVGIPQVMEKFRERWRPMAWTIAVSYLVTLAPLIGATLVALAIFSFVGGIGAGLVGVFLLMAGSGGTLVLSALLVYTPVVVMAEGSSGMKAVGRSVAIGRGNFGISVTYGVVYFFFTTAVTYVTSLVPSGVLPLSSMASVGVLILVTPVLHLGKTLIFKEVTSETPAEREFLPSFTSDARSLLTYVWRTLLSGLGELKRYVLDISNLPFHLLSAVAIALGWAVGVYVANHGLDAVLIGLGYSSGRINPLVTGSLPFSIGIYIFFHNWQVSLATALSGVWFSAASFATLFLNGVLVGAVSGLVPNSLMLAAALLPHGVIEIPSFVLAGSIGIKLGVSFLRAVRGGGPEAAEELHRVARQSVYIVVGLALLFLIAGIIEGNVTPLIMKMAGWQ